MKTSFKILFTVLFLQTLSCQKSQESNAHTNTNQTGNSTEKTVTGSFNKIEVSTGIAAEVIKSGEEKAVVYAPADVLDEVIAEIINDKLTIRMKQGIRLKSVSGIRAKIYVKDFDEIEANSAAAIKILDEFMQDDTDISVSSSGSISGNLEANKMNIDASSAGSFAGKIWAVNLSTSSSSSGQIEVSGKAKNLTAEASSAGSFLGTKFTANHGNLDASSGGSITVSLTESMEADANSGGSIRYIKGENLTKIHYDENSGGSVRAYNSPENSMF